MEEFLEHLVRESLEDGGWVMTEEGEGITQVSGYR